MPSATLMESVMSAALGLKDNSDAELGGYDLVLRLSPDKAVESPQVRESVANALYNKGVTLGQLNRTEEAIQTYDELLRRLGDAAELGLRNKAANALVNKGVALSQRIAARKQSRPMTNCCAALAMRLSLRCASLSPWRSSTRATP